jgi:hypothetical protein
LPKIVTTRACTMDLSIAELRAGRDRRPDLDRRTRPTPAPRCRRAAEARG